MQYFLFFIISFILSLTITPLVRLFALRKGLVSYPRADRWHKKPTALLGGISIYLAAMIPSLIINPLNKNMLGLYIGGAFLFIVGLIDDKWRLTPYTKLFTQIIAGGIAILSGVVLALPINNAFVIPLTILWIIAVTNSFNLLDNIDGLAAGIAAISALMVFASSLFYSNNPFGIFALILSGAALGFLPYNFNPAKIFMGDSGSMFLGYSLAIVSISGTTRHVSNFLITLIVPVLILSVPLFDTLFVMVGRKLQGKKIFEGGKDHTSHRLVALGLSQRKTVLLLYAVSIVFSLIALSYSQLNGFIIITITFLGAVILLFFGIFIFEVATYDNKLKYHQHLKQMSENKTIINSIFLYKRRILEVLLDLISICIAYYLAYFLRFEGVLLNANLVLIGQSLVWIILIKMSVFFAFGLYRGIWRYISVYDLVAVFKVASIGSVASILFLTFVFRFHEYSRAVFFIDWILLLFLVSGSRIMFRLLGEFFSGVGKKENNVLIYGAGDTGEMAIREIKRNKNLNYNPIGFIDDNPSKSSSRIQGVIVLGSRARIKELVRLYNIHEILIAIPSLDAADLAEIVSICESCGVGHKKVKGILDKEG